MSPGIYQHYKGNFYLILHVAHHTETGEEMVVYQALYGDLRLWTRPLNMFLENIEYNGVMQPRFKKVANASQAERFMNLVR